MESSQQIIILGSHTLHAIPMVMITIASGLYLSRIKNATAYSLLSGSILTLLGSILGAIMNMMLLNQIIHPAIYSKIIVLVQILSYSGNFIFAGALISLVIKHTRTTTPAAPSQQAPTPAPQCT